MSAAFRPAFGTNLPIMHLAPSVRHFWVTRPIIGLILPFVSPLSTSVFINIYTENSNSFNFRNIVGCFVWPAFVFSNILASNGAKKEFFFPDLPSPPERPVRRPKTLPFRVARWSGNHREKAPVVGIWRGCRKTSDPVILSAAKDLHGLVYTYTASIHHWLDLSRDKMPEPERPIARPTLA